MTAPRSPLHRPDADAAAASAHAHAASAQAHAARTEAAVDGPPAPPRPLTGAEQDTLNDDWTKVAAWDVTDASGRPVTSLDQLAEVLDTDRTSAAGMLLDSPMSAAAPPELVAEANSEVNPAGQASLYDEFDDVEGAGGAPDDPEEYDAETYDPAVDDEADQGDEEDPEDALDDGADEEEEGDGPPFAKKGGKSYPRAGAFVAFGGEAGKVEVVVTNGGKVPGVPGGLVGTKSAPAARVRLYRKAGGRWLPTGQRVAASAAELKTIRSLEGPAAVVEGKDVTARLVLLVAENPRLAVREDMTPGEALAEVYRRGQDAWPGEAVTALSAKDWALGRAQAFITLAKGGQVPNYVNDNDLLR